MLQKIIEEIIQPLFVDTATWVEKYGGLVQTLEVKTTIDPSTGKQQVQKWPISCDVNQTECNEPSDTYRDLVPDDSKASILYFEEVQPMTFAGFINNTSGGIMRNWQKYTGRVRLVVWLNAARLGVGDQNGNYTCDWSYPFLDQMLKLINIKGKATSGTFAGGWYDIRPRGIVRKDLGIFSKYTFDKYKNYYRYPFDYFAIDFDVNMEFCVGSNTVIPTGAVINCPFSQSLLNLYSMLFDGIDEYQQVDDSAIFSFGDGVNDTPFTWSLWIKPIGTGFAQFILDKRGSSVFPGKDEYQITITPDGVLNVLLFSNGNSMNYLFAATNIGAITFNSWQNIVITYDGSSLFSGISVYINKVNQSLNNNSLGTYVAMNDYDRPLNIGAPSWRADLRYRGNVDEIGLFDVAFDASDVEDVYNSGLPKALTSHSKSANLVYWNRQGDRATWDGSKWIIPDASVNNTTTITVNMEEADRVTDVPT